MEFGYHNASFVYDTGPPTNALLDHAQFLEEAGFSWFSLMDHLWQLPGVGQPTEPFVECYAGLSAVAAATSKMELSALVTCVGYRNPGYLAKLVASLDSLSDGRAVLGIGAGWYEDEFDALGIDFPDPATRIRQLRDVVRLCRAAWTEPSPVSYEGEYFDLDGLYLDPKPEKLPVLIGGTGEQLTLRVVAEYADRWNTVGRSPDVYAEKLAVLREHCETVGRDPEELVLTATLPALIRGSSEAAHDAYEARTADAPRDPPSRDEFRGLVGTPEEAAELVDAYAELGVASLQIMPPQNDRETVERFADQVMG